VAYAGWMIRQTGTKRCRCRHNLSRGRNDLRPTREDYFPSIIRDGCCFAEALKRRDWIKRLVYISSLAAVGPARDGTPVNEETLPAPVTPYGAAS